MSAGSERDVTGFFIPSNDAEAGEQIYAQLRAHLLAQRGRSPNRRRISELWTRRGSRDCVTCVGKPDPIWGTTVSAIFDMGPQQPFIVYRQDDEHPEQLVCDVLGCSAYSVSEFAR